MSYLFTLTKVTAGAVIADNVLVRGDGGASGIQGSGITLSDANGLSWTIADGENSVGLSVTQNDITNNPDAIQITNAGTGNSIQITDSGAKGTSNSGAGALLVNLTHTSGVGIAANIRALNIATTHNLLRINSDIAYQTRMDGAQTIDTSTTQITVDSTSGYPSSGILRVVNATSTNENAKTIFTHYTSTDATHFIGTAGVFFKESTPVNIVDNALVDYLDSTNTASILEVIDNNTNGGMVNLKLTGVNPDLEFVAKGGFDGSSGEGKFEIDVPNGDSVVVSQVDCIRINGRVDANNSFAPIAIFTRPGISRQGLVGIGFQNLAAPVTLSAKFHVKNDDFQGDTNAPSLVVTKFQGADSQTADLTQWLNDAGSVLLSVDANGVIELTRGISGGGLAVTEVTGTSQSATVNSLYITNNTSVVTVTIPTAAAVGDVVRVVGKGAGGWIIAQNASEIIHFGNQDTTTGTGGSLASSHRYDAVELVCTVANTEWTVMSSIGNPTVT